MSDFPHYYTQAMQLCFISRIDVVQRLSHTVSDSEKYEYFAFWWLTHAKKEYPKQFELTSSLVKLANQIVEQKFGYPITKFMNFILQSRSDFEGVYSSQNKEETEKFLTWYYVHGLTEYKLHGLITETQKIFLAQPHDSIPYFNTRFPITNLMYLIWSQRDDLKKHTSLNTQAEQHWLVKWFYIQGCQEQNLHQHLDLSIVKALNSAVDNVEQNSLLPITYLMYFLWSYDENLKNNYDLNTADGRIQYAEWFKNSGSQLKNLKSLSSFENLSQKEVNSEHSLTTGIKSKKISDKRFGINLVGYATGDLGIGEDVRMMAKSLGKTDIPFCVINHKPSEKISQTDQSIVEHFEKKPIYSITILCMTGLETINLWLKNPEIFRNQYVIGYWPWELPKWPRDWEPAYSLVDEVWASSRFTQNAYRNAPIPVKHMPMAVSVDRLKKSFNRDYFNLPENRFLFLFAFDFMSYPTRKNPYACVKSFLKAFPRGTEKTNLVLKISNLHKDDPEWKKIKKLCKKDPRIIIIKETFTREELLGLFDVCNAYVSLHCSEGFGRTLAEALLLGKPVIATNFSGNTDFINNKNAYPVRYQLKAIKQGAYPGCNKQKWAKVDLKDAAIQLYKVYQIACNLPKHIFKLSQKYNAEVCGAKYHKHIKKIWNKIPHG